MQATEEPADAKPIAPRRRGRVLVACFVLFGALLVVSRTLPNILTIFYG